MRHTFSHDGADIFYGEMLTNFSGLALNTVDSEIFA